MENTAMSIEDYQINSGTVTVERVFTDSKTIKDLLKEYLLKEKCSSALRY